VHSSFVPFIGQTANYLGRLDAGPSAVTVAALKNCATPAESRGRGCARSQGERVFSLAEAATAQNIQFTMDGFYDIRRPTAAMNWWP